MSGISGILDPAAGTPEVARRLGEALAGSTGAEPDVREVPGGALGAVGPGVGGAHSEVTGRVLVADGLTDAAAAALLDTIGEDLSEIDLSSLEQPFALALHDESTRTLVLARDALGRAPLYWWADEAAGTLLFASRLEALLASGRVPVRPDAATIHRFLLRGEVDRDERTFLEGVRRLLPGQVLRHGPEGTTLTTDERTVSALRQVAAGGGRPLDDTVTAEAAELLAASVRRAAGEESAVALDGTPGSLAVAAAAPGPVRVAAATRPGGSVPAAVTGLHAARGEEMQLATVPAPGSTLLEDLGELAASLGEPVPSTAAHTAHVLARAAAGSGATVLLDGAGAAALLPDDPAHQVGGLRRLRSGRRIGDLARGALASRTALVGQARAALAPRAAVPTEALLANDFVAAHSSPAASQPADLRTALLETVLTGAVPADLRASRAAADHAGLVSRSPFVDEDLLRLLLSLDEASLLAAARDGALLRGAIAELAPGTDLPAVITSAATDEHAWIVEHAAAIREVLASDSFAARPYVDARSVLAFFDDVVAHPEHHRSEQIWRLLSLELWLRAVVDPRADEEPAVPAAPVEELDPDRIEAPKADHEPNPGKQLDLVSTVDHHTWRRLPLQTDLVGRGDDLTAIVTARLERTGAELPAGTVPAGAPWYYVISEKIVAITQGRSWYTWEIHPRPSAKVLSRFVTRTPAGIGLGDPTTMELAIREVGLPRVLVASAAGAAGKLLRRRGVFYEVVGENVRAIDGPTPYSAFPSNVSAKLPPKDPDTVAAQLSAAIRAADLPAELLAGFRGTVVMDANDIGRNVLGSDVDTPKSALEATFADNPLGQGRQRTPMAVLVDLGTPDGAPQA